MHEPDLPKHPEGFQGLAPLCERPRVQQKMYQSEISTAAADIDYEWTKSQRSLDLIRFVDSA
jgi:hypothetical protein